MTGQPATRPILTAEGVSPRSPVPLYTQLRELLRSRILTGVYKSHSQMPSEHDLVRTFGVSRITVRQALTDLQQEGLIFRIHGKGTFVAKPKATQNLWRLEGFGEAMSASGHETYSRVLGHKVMRATPAIAAQLGLAAGAEVLELRRLRHLDREPISLDVSYLTRELGERLVREDLARRDVFLILENDLGIALGNADLHIESVAADAGVARALAVEERSPILRIQRLTFTAGGTPLDFEYLFYRGDSFQYRLRVERRTRYPAARVQTLEQTT